MIQFSVQNGFIRLMLCRRFGTSKRFSETDKKDMSEMIAIKLQIADDEANMEMIKIKEKLNETTEILTGRDKLAQVGMIILLH